MAMTDREVGDEMRKVMDPELKINIVDLGLIYKIQITNNKKQTKIHILMTLTTPGCPLAGMFETLIKHALKKLSGIDVNKDVQIELTFDPHWTSDMMSEAAKAGL